MLDKVIDFILQVEPDFNKTLLSNIKAKRRPIPKKTIINLLNYLSCSSSLSYLVPDIYSFILEFNFEISISEDNAFIKYMVEMRKFYDI